MSTAIFGDLVGSKCTRSCAGLWGLKLKLMAAFRYTSTGGPSSQSYRIILFIIAIVMILCLYPSPSSHPPLPEKKNSNILENKEQWILSHWWRSGLMRPKKTPHFLQPMSLFKIHRWNHTEQCVSLPVFRQCCSRAGSTPAPWTYQQDSDLRSWEEHFTINERWFSRCRGKSF